MMRKPHSDLNILLSAEGQEDLLEEDLEEPWDSIRFTHNDLTVSARQLAWGTIPSEEEIIKQIDEVMPEIIFMRCLTAERKHTGQIYVEISPFHEGDAFYVFDHYHERDGAKYRPFRRLLRIAQLPRTMPNVMEYLDLFNLSTHIDYDDTRRGGIPSFRGDTLKSAMGGSMKIYDQVERLERADPGL